MLEKKFALTRRSRRHGCKSTRRMDEPVHGKKWKRSKDGYIWVVYSSHRRYKNEDTIRKDEIYDEPVCCSHCDDFVHHVSDTYREALFYVLEKYHGKQPWHIIIRKALSDYCR